MPSEEPEYLALYGTLIRGLGDAARDAIDELGIADCLDRVEPCSVRGQLIDLGAYPGLIHGEDAVEAELHRVRDPAVWPILDAFEGYDPLDLARSLYLRERIDLIAPEGISAWVYRYNQAPEEGQRIESGSWRRHLQRGST